MTLPPGDDGELGLIERSKAGDRQAFAQLVAMHQGRVRAYIGTYLRHTEVVDDIAQDVFLTGFRSLSAYDGQSMALWLLGIARHRLLRHLRRDSRKRRSFDELLFRGLL